MRGSALPLGFVGGVLFLLHLFLEVDYFLGGLVELLVEEDVEVATWVVQEVLDEAAIEEVTVDVELLLPVNHVLVLEGVRRVPHRAAALRRLGRLVALLAPVLCELRVVARQARDRLRLARDTRCRILCLRHGRRAGLLTLLSRG